jgi:hypothetical protein
MASRAAAPASAPPGSFGYRCSRCGDHAAGGWATSCVLIIAAKHGGAKHAFRATYDGFGAAETEAGERVHLTQFRDRWAETAKYDLELRFTPAAAEIYCAGAPLDAPPKAPARSCAPKGLAPQRSLRNLRESLVATKDIVAGGPASAAQPTVAQAAIAAAAQAVAQAAALVTATAAAQAAKPAGAAAGAPAAAAGAKGGEAGAGEGAAAAAPAAPSPPGGRAKRAAASPAAPAARKRGKPAAK